MQPQEPTTYPQTDPSAPATQVTLTVTLPPMGEAGADEDRITSEVRQGAHTAAILAALPQALAAAQIELTGA